MKKFIPILCMTAFTLSLQNCGNRDEDPAGENLTTDNYSLRSQHRNDSTTTKQSIIDPDPPVRDGDNWRIDPAKK